VVLKPKPALASGDDKLNDLKPMQQLNATSIVL